MQPANSSPRSLKLRRGTSRAARGEKKCLCGAPAALSTAGISSWCSRRSIAGAVDRSKALAAIVNDVTVNLAKVATASASYTSGDTKCGLNDGFDPVNRMIRAMQLRQLAAHRCAMGAV